MTTNIEDQDMEITTNIETYLNSLSDDILILDVSFKGIKSLPNLTRFKNLKEEDDLDVVLNNWK
jgi:hypothetical protein